MRVQKVFNVSNSTVYAAMLAETDSDYKSLLGTNLRRLGGMSEVESSCRSLFNVRVELRTGRAEFEIHRIYS